MKFARINGEPYLEATFFHGFYKESFKRTGNGSIKEEQSGAFFLCNFCVNQLSSVSIVNACKFQRKQNVILEDIAMHLQ